ncbi:MAG: class F sortase [Chloroflexota bacterium]|nr:class F sortase [Dehalococcoidia bacterium]MDW8255106.1 class F sortase [Chloroflexota bacterium]
MRRWSEVIPSGGQPFPILLAVAALFAVSAACARPAPEWDEPTPIPGLDQILRPAPSPNPLRPHFVIPTMAPVPATRNPVGLPPVKVATAAANPVHLRIQAIGLDLPIQPSSLTPNRELAAPSDALGVVWYKDGAKPGMRGNAVLTGHVDWQGRPGAFYRLKELLPGDIIQIFAADGQQFLYTVDTTHLYRADDAPVAEIMGAKDIPLLTLITCEGTWDPIRQDYTHRRVVRAMWY